MPCPKETKKKEKREADKMRFLSQTPLRQKLPDTSSTSEDVYHYFFPRGSASSGQAPLLLSSGQAGAAVSPHPAPERMDVKIQYTEGVLGDKSFVYYKHASDSDSEWQHIRTNSHAHAELIADVLQGYKIKPASKVQVTVNATQTKPAPEPYVVYPRVVQRHRLGDESMYLAEPPWHVGAPRVIHSGSCTGYDRVGVLSIQGRHALAEFALPQISSAAV